tara:strand:- start:724 stop:1179 length:456 start_codon:yes stop_codon:yes gene_type:complete
MSIVDPLFENSPTTFVNPTGQNFLTIRAIIYDSWITWKDALPDDIAQHSLLSEDIYNNIIELAGRVHKLHQSLPNYKATTESPYEFVLWWDPSDTDENWNSGKTCRFMIEDFTAQDLLHYNSTKRNSRLSLKALTNKLVEASAISQVPKSG